MWTNGVHYTKGKKKFMSKVLTQYFLWQCWSVKKLLTVFVMSVWGVQKVLTTVCVSPVRYVVRPCWLSVCTWWWLSGWPHYSQTCLASTLPTCCWSAASSSVVCPSWASWELWRRTAVSFWRYDTHSTPGYSNWICCCFCLSANFSWSAVQDCLR